MPVLPVNCCLVVTQSDNSLAFKGVKVSQDLQMQEMACQFQL
jgi:hypothetical protein